jgi:subtilase family serine protease
MNDKSVASRTVLFALTLALGPLACAPERPGNHVAPVITDRIDEAALVTLSGNTRPEALKAEYDLGRIEDGFMAQHLLLQLTRSDASEHELETRISELQTPGSPRYHQWMTAEEYGNEFGLADSDLAAVRGWLESHGLHVGHINTARTLIDFSGTAAQLREAFHTELHQLNVNGARHIANISDPQIPAALQPAVAGVVSMHDFRPSAHVMPKPAYTVSSNQQILAPEDFQTIYNLGPLFTAGVSGQHQTIVVIEDSDVYSTDDWQTFRTKLGMSSYTASFTQVHPAPASGDNNCLPPGVAGASFEAIIDAEWATVSAPSANIVLASCSDGFTFGGLVALNNMLNTSTTANPMPGIVSISYGECESNNGAASNAAYKTVYQQAVAEGVSVFVSAGDSGAAGCDQNRTAGTHGIAVSAFTSTPYNVSVGGTDFGDTFAHTASTYWSSHNTATFGSALSYVPEIPWNDSCASQLFSSYFHFQVPYGNTGFCASSTGTANFLSTGAGSGGPSGCATGQASQQSIVSGACRGWAKPAWQVALGVPNDGVRDIPDVSLFSATGYWGHYLLACDTNPADGYTCDGAPSGWAGGGGTSFAAPAMAGIQALVNQKWGRQGNPNATYYKLAATEFGTAGSADCNSTKGKTVASTCIFNDVTQGDINVNCTGPNSCFNPGTSPQGVLSTSASGFGSAYGAHTGWDFATGLGSVNATNLVNSTAWSATPAISWTPPHR